MTGYLADLGVGWVYSLPLLRPPRAATTATTWSTTPASTRRAAGARASTGSSRRARHGLGVVVDIVPNHVGVADAAAAPWWWDVLQHGRDSRARGRVRHRLGVRRRQGPPPGARRADDAGRAEASMDGELRYYDHRFPIAPGTGEGTPREVHARQHYELVAGGAPTPS